MRTTAPRPLSGRLLARLGGLLVALTLGLAGCSDDEEAPAAPEPAPRDDASLEVMSFIPPDSPVYVEVSTDFEGEQWTQLEDLAELFPAYPEVREELDEELSEGLDGGATFDEVEELLGDRAAIAIVSLELPDEGLSRALQVSPDEDIPDAVDDFGGGSTPEPEFVGVVALADDGGEDGAIALLEANDFSPAGECEGVEYLTNDDEDTYVAVTDGHLVVADTSEILCESLAAHAGGDTAADEERYAEALALLPESTLVEGYLDLGLIVEQVAADQPELEELGIIGDYQDSVIALSLSTEPEGVRLEGLITNAPESIATEAFAPELLDRVPADAYAYLGLFDPASLASNTIVGLEGEAGAQAREQLEFFSSQLENQLGITVGDLSALFSGELGVFVAPGDGFVPIGALMLGVEDGERAQETLGQLRMALPLLLQQFVGLGVPEFEPVELEDGVEGFTLPLEDGLSVTYGVDGDLVIVGTSPEAVRSVQSPGDSLADSEAFEAGTPGIPDEISSLLWINIEEALGLAESVGAFEEEAGEVLPNLQPLKSLAFWSSGTETPRFTLFAHIAE